MRPCTHTPSGTGKSASCRTRTAATDTTPATAVLPAARADADVQRADAFHHERAPPGRSDGAAQGSGPGNTKGCPGLCRQRCAGSEWDRSAATRPPVPSDESRHRDAHRPGTRRTTRGDAGRALGRPAQDLRQRRRHGARAGRCERHVPARPLHRGDGALGLGQVDADALHGGVGPADVGPGLRGRHRARAPRRHRASPRCGATGSASCSSRSTWCPTLTAAENITLPADLAGRKVDKEWFDYLVKQLGITDRLHAPPDRVVGRPAAALRLCPGADQPARPDLRRRADGQPRLQLVERDAGLPAAVGRRVRPVDRHGDARRRTAPPSPTGSCSWPTGRSSTSSPTRRPTRCSSGCGPWAPDMWKVTIKGLLAHKLRLALTALAIVLGRDVHRRDLRPHRHAAQHVRHAVREHLPERRLPGARRGAQFGSGGNATREPRARVRAVDRAGGARGGRRPRER